MPQTTVTSDPELPTVRVETPAAAAFQSDADPRAELDRQLQVYLDLGYPELLGVEEEQLRATVAELGAAVDDLPAPEVPPEDHVAFVLVPDPSAGRLNDRVPGMRRGPRRGVSVIDEPEARRYRPVPPVTVPGGAAYLVTGIDVGARLVGVTPENAVQQIIAAGRTPLTVAEGLALVTVRPDMLRPNRCFSLAGSRTGADQRVPAIWISERRPKLGWCWDRNPHTWLGTASAAERRGGGS